MVNYELYEGTGALATVATKSKCRWRKRVGVERNVGTGTTDFTGFNNL